MPCEFLGFVFFLCACRFGAHTVKLDCKSKEKARKKLTGVRSRKKLLTDGLLMCYHYSTISFTSTFEMAFVSSACVLGLVM